MSTSTLLHIVPLQISLAGQQAVITCSDSRAKINAADELVFELKPQAPGEPPVTQLVCFTVADPPDPQGYDDYFHMYAAPPLERLKVWTKDDATSTSPNYLPGCDLEVVAVAFREPRPDTTTEGAVNVKDGRRRIKIRYEGADDATLFHR